MTPALSRRVMQTLVESATLLERIHEMGLDTKNTVAVSRLALAETYRLLRQSVPDPPEPRNEPPFVRYSDIPDMSTSTIVFR